MLGLSAATTCDSDGDPWEEGLVGNGFAEEKPHPCEWLRNDGWEGRWERLSLQRQWGTEEVFPAARGADAGQVWEATAGHDVAGVPSACSLHSFGMSAAVLFSLLI